MFSGRHHSKAHDTQRSNAGHSSGGTTATAAESQRIEWSRATILGFIEDYRQQRVLWDPNTKGYHIKQTKYEALKELGRKYSAEIRSIRSKIKSLRSSFHREHGKVINGRRKGVHYQPMWFAYEAIRFILDGEQQQQQQQQQQRALTAKLTAAERRAAAAARGGETTVPLTKLERQQRKLAERQLDLVLAHAATKVEATKSEPAVTASDAAEVAGDNESADVDVEEKLAAAAAEHNAELSLAAAVAEEQRQRTAFICAGRSVTDLASLCGGFLGASRSAMTEALLLTLEQELKEEALQQRATSAASTSSCASSSAVASPMACSNKTTTICTATPTTVNGATLSAATAIMSSGNHNRSMEEAVAAGHATYTASSLTLADSNNNHTSNSHYCGNSNNNHNANSSIVARVAAAMAAAAITASSNGSSTATTTTSANGLLLARSADELAAAAASSDVGGLDSGSGCVSRNDFDSDSQTYCNIRAEDVKTELIESDSAELAMLERPPPVTSIPPYMYYKLQEPIKSSRKRKSHTPQHCHNEDAPSPSKQQYQQPQQHSNLNLNINNHNNNNQQHDLSSGPAALLTNGVNCCSSNSSNSNSSASPSPIAAVADAHNMKTLSTSTDEYGVFGEYVAITIRRLKTSKAKIVVKHLINNLLYEAELGKYDHGMPASKEPPHLYKM